MQSSTSGREFSQCLEKSCLPADLQRLALVCGFCQCVVKVNPQTDLRCCTLGVQSLIVCREFRQSLETPGLPAGLHCLSVGCGFCQSVEKVSLPTDLRCFTLGMLSFTFGREVNQNVEKVKLPIRSRWLPGRSQAP